VRGDDNAARTKHSSMRELAFVLLVLFSLCLLLSLFLSLFAFPRSARARRLVSPIATDRDPSIIDDQERERERFVNQRGASASSASLILYENSPRTVKVQAGADRQLDRTTRRT